MSGDKRFDEWGCSECKGPAFREQDSKRAARNCDGRHPNVSLGFEWAPSLRRCPFAVITPEAMSVIDLWSEWKNYGGLPFPGSLYDQPGPICDAVKLVELEYIRRPQKQPTITLVGPSNDRTRGNHD
jgi:hypothetical protein